MKYAISPTWDSPNHVCCGLLVDPTDFSNVVLLAQPEKDSLKTHSNVNSVFKMFLWDFLMMESIYKAN